VRKEIQFGYDFTQIQVPKITRGDPKVPATNFEISYKLLMRKDVADVYENIRKV
jgi:hypothetical protein